MSKTAAIIPAYNEEKTVAAVVSAFKNSGRFQTIIVVSDGSTDQTAEAAKAAGADAVYEFSERSGKGAAMLHGLRHTDAEIIFFADADLVGFKSEHAALLLDPVIRGEAAMAVGLRYRGAGLVSFMRFLPLIGGERAMRREVIETIRPEHLRGFHAEEALNYNCRKRGLKYLGILLPGLHIRTKVHKVGWRRALPQYLKMSWEILAAIIGVRIADLFGKFLKSGEKKL